MWRVPAELGVIVVPLDGGGPLYLDEVLARSRPGLAPSPTR